MYLKFHLKWNNLTWNEKLRMYHVSNPFLFYPSRNKEHQTTNVINLPHRAKIHNQEIRLRNTIKTDNKNDEFWIDARKNVCILCEDDDGIKIKYSKRRKNSQTS